MIINKDNITDVSKQQRIVFVDNINNEQALELSQTYKFGVFMGNGPSFTDTLVEQNAGLIYKNGKRFSLVTGINKSPIRLGLYNIGLTINDKGILGLQLLNAVDNFKLIKYVTAGQEYYYNDDTYITIYNEGDLYFRLNDENNNIINSTEDSLYFTNDLIYNGYISTPQIIYDDINNDEYTVKYHITNLKETNNTYKELSVALLTDLSNENAQVETYNIRIINSSSNIFYIGDVYDYLTTESVIIYNDELTNLSESGWHSFDPAFNNLSSAEDVYKYYTLYPYDVLNTDRFGINIPESMKPRLDLIYENQRLPDYQEDNSGVFKKSHTLIVNDNRYCIYQFNKQIININGIDIDYICKKCFTSYIG